MRKIIEKLYFNSPVWAQNIGISSYGYYWKKRRMGGIYNIEYEKCREREYYTFDQWKIYQKLELRKILTHSINHVPYYKNLFKSCGIDINQIKNFELKDIKAIPYLTKDDLRKFGKTELLSNILKKTSFFPSSGSTGTPTEILISPKMHQKWTAGFENRIREWAGIDKNTPKGSIGGRRIVQDGISKGPYFRYNYFEKQVYFSAYHISQNTTENYVYGMKKYGIEYMTGYAMSNYFLARFIQILGIKAPKLKAVITSSEKMTNKMRKTFQQVYGCDTFDSYSGVEDCGMISECSSGSLHISPDMGIIEIKNRDGNDAKPGEIGEAICTGILNYDQPLIRYKIGDFIKLSDKTICPCGRNMPIVEEIIGRIEDTVIGPDGREMVRFHGVFIGISNIIEAQVIQYEIDKFEIKYVSTGEISLDETVLIKKRMVSQLGDIKIKLNRVKSIPKNNNGKFQAVISKVKFYENN